MNSPISGNPYHAPTRDTPNRVKHGYYSTPLLMQLAAQVLFDFSSYSDADREWVAGQLKNRADCLIDSGVNP